MDPFKEERPLSDLVGELTRETSALIRKEVQLATTELKDKATTAGHQVKWIGLGGVLANTGLIVVSAALVIALGAVMPLAVAALLVGATLLIGGYVTAQSAVRKVAHIQPAPRHALQALKENKLWLEQQLR